MAPKRPVSAVGVAVTGAPRAVASVADSAFGMDAILLQSVTLRRKLPWDLLSLSQRAHPCGASCSGTWDSGHQSLESKGPRGASRGPLLEAFTLGGILVTSAALGGNQAGFADRYRLPAGGAQAGRLEVRPSLLRAIAADRSDV